MASISAPEDLNLFREGQKVLERQRFQFPSGWLYSDNVEGEWDAFSDILSRKDALIQAQVSTLQAKIRQEDGLVETKTHVRSFFPSFFAF